MTCKQYEAYIVEWKLEELDSSKVKLLETHFKSCPSCLKFANETDALFGGLDSIKEAQTEPPAGYFSTLLARTRRRIEAEQKPSFIQRLIAGVRLQVPAISMTVLLLAVFLSSKKIYDFELMDESRLYAQMAEEMIAHGIHTQGIASEIFLKQMNNLSDEKIDKLINTLEKTLEATS